MKCRPCLTLLSTIVLSSLENVCIPRILMVCLDYIVTTSFALIRWYGCAPVHGWLDYRICLLWHRSYQCYRRTFALSSTKRQNIAAIPPTMFRRDSGKPSKCKKHFPFSVHNRNTIRIYDIVIRCYAFEPFPFFIPIYIIFFFAVLFLPLGWASQDFSTLRLLFFCPITNIKRVLRMDSCFWHRSSPLNPKQQTHTH